MEVSACRIAKREKSLGAVDEEQGYRWDAGATANLVNGQFFPRAHANLHTGIMFIKHAPLWLRTSIGNSFSDRDDPQANFANFYFGGFGNNWFDFRGVQRFRDYYSFPGVDLNHIGGTNFARVMGEWILPPLRFRRLGSPMFFLTGPGLLFSHQGLLRILTVKITGKVFQILGFNSISGWYFLSPKINFFCWICESKRQVNWKNI